MKLIGCFVLAFIFCIFYCFWMPWGGNNFGIDNIRVNKMRLCIDDQQLPCRWVGNYQYDLGTPIFNYVAPLSYYIGGYAFSIFEDSQLITKILYLLPLLFIGLGAGLLTRNRGWRIINCVIFSSVIYILYGIGLFVFGLNVGILWSIGTFILVLITYLRLTDKKTVKNSLWLAIFMALFILSTQEAVFILFGVVIIAGFFEWLSKRMRLLMLLLFSWVLSIGLGAFYVFPMIIESDQVKLNAINGEFLPISVRSIPDRDPIEEITILAGEAQIFGFEEHSASFRFGVDNGDHSIIRLAVPYFPNWEIKANGVPIKNYYDNNSLGLTTLIFGEGRFVVEGRLMDTPVREISNIVSLVSLAVLLFMLFSEMSRIRSGLRYYLKALHS
jgi:hypothetical protein